MSAATPRVFLSYARKDGEAFATALRRRLEAEEPEIALWQDRARMEGGVGWWKQIEEALDRVKFLVIVMTPAAMASEIARREWRYARQKGVIVYPVKGAADAVLDYSSLPNWMRKAHFFDLDKEWVTFTNFLKSDRQPVRVPFMAPEMPEAFVPRRLEFDSILSLVLDPTRQNPVAITTALQGAGGYGKTTLATALCHDDRVLDAFDDGILWVTLGQTPNVLNELAKVYEALTGEQGAKIRRPRLERGQCDVVEGNHPSRASVGLAGAYGHHATQKVDLLPLEWSSAFSASRSRSARRFRWRSFVLSLTASSRYDRGTYRDHNARVYSATTTNCQRPLPKCAARSSGHETHIKCTDETGTVSKAKAEVEA